MSNDTAVHFLDEFIKYIPFIDYGRLNAETKLFLYALIINHTLTKSGIVLLTYSR